MESITSVGGPTEAQLDKLAGRIGVEHPDDVRLAESATDGS